MGNHLKTSETNRGPAVWHWGSRPNPLNKQGNSGPPEWSQMVLKDQKGEARKFEVFPRGPKYFITIYLPKTCTHTPLPKYLIQWYLAPQGTLRDPFSNSEGTSAPDLEPSKNMPKASRCPIIRLSKFLYS